jgi:hypothetical protein
VTADFRGLGGITRALASYAALFTDQQGVCNRPFAEVAGCGRYKGGGLAMTKADEAAGEDDLLYYDPGHFHRDLGQICRDPGHEIRAEDA